MVAQSWVGSAAMCAAKVPVAPLNLPKYSVASTWHGQAPQPRDEDRELLADRGRGRRLPVRVREHRRRRGASTARSWSASMTSCSFGSHTSRTAAPMVSA